MSNKEYLRSYYLANIERIKEQQRKWYIKNRTKQLEYSQTYSIENRDKINQRRRKYRYKRISQPRYYKYRYVSRFDLDPVVIKSLRQRVRELYHKNKLIKKPFYVIRREKEKEYGGECSSAVWSQRLKRGLLKQFCSMCGSNEKLSIDHIISFSKWDNSIDMGYKYNDRRNIQVLCLECNHKKSNKIYESTNPKS